MTQTNYEQLLAQATEGIEKFLRAEQEAGHITGAYFDAALANTVPNLQRWLLADELDAISPNTRRGLSEAIQEHRWVDLANAFSKNVSFGTGGIREKMGADRDVLLTLKRDGIHAPVIKGPNTINDVVLLLTSAGVAQYGKSRSPQLSKVVIGFDTRICGEDFARIIARLFLAYDYTVFLFDEPCMYPSVTFAVPRLRAHIGVFISASHNDFRYNGYKLSCHNGSQFDPAERKDLYENFIRKMSFGDIRMIALAEAKESHLWFLGGEPHVGLTVTPPPPLPEMPGGKPLGSLGPQHYAGRSDHIIDLHSLYAKHVKQFLAAPKALLHMKQPVYIGYAAFNGSGRKLVPRMLREVGFEHIRKVSKLDQPDGMFPVFCSDPGREQQPDPGDWRAADIAVREFKDEHPRSAWDGLDLMLGTDPDSDRCGIIVKVPKHQRKAYPHGMTGDTQDWTLLSADECWTMILWYRLMREAEQSGTVPDAQEKFLALSHTTTDLLVQLARKHGIGVIRTWVGFAQLAAATRAAWDLARGTDTPGITEDGAFPAYVEGRRSDSDEICNRTVHSLEQMNGRSFNIAAMEQSNGFSILGGVPKDESSLGTGGHVRDKDGALASVLVAELAAYAKDEGISLLDLMDEKIFLDSDIGLYITHYEPDPLDGEYEGLAGYSKKRTMLDAADDLCRNHEAKNVTFAEMPVVATTIYRTGKYDGANWPGFPDEGLRFFFDQERRSHVTIRPSGTSNALRFHVQLYGGVPTSETVVEEKARLRELCKRVVSDVRRLIGAPR